MPNHYPPADEIADALLPYRWQVKTIEDARELVVKHKGMWQQPLREQIAQALFKRRGRADQ